MKKNDIINISVDKNNCWSIRTLDERQTNFGGEL